MKRYLTITIDVEPDSSKNWKYSDPLNFRGVHEGIGERLHPLFEKYGVVPTYLINNVVLEDESSTNFFKQLNGRFELGTHLHPEFIEPEKKFDNYAGKSGRANCCFYPPQIEAAKIASITSLFQKNFGYNPVSFRAGRFSAGANTIRSLASLGYKVDTSVTPHICWDDSTREKAVDFTKALEQPYFINEHSIVKEDANGKILQVPVTIGLVKRNTAKEFLSSAAGFRHRFRNYKPMWLRPYYSSASQMKKIVELFSEKYAENGQVVFNMMFHNVEVMPGLNPYTSSENECENYLDQLKAFFSYCNENLIEGCRLSEIYDVCKK